MVKNQSVLELSYVIDCIENEFNSPGNNKQNDLKNLHDKNYSSLYQYSYLMLRSDVLAEAAVEKVFVDYFSGNIADMGGCPVAIFRSLRLDCISLLKQRSLDDLEYLLFGQPVITFVNSDLEVNGTFQGQYPAVLNRLEPVQREVIFLKENIGLSLSQISMILNLSQTIVYDHLNFSHSFIAKSIINL